jgi:hypothetical protein
MSGPIPSDKLRCQLDDVLALCIEAQNTLRLVIARMSQRARTLPEADDIVSLIEVRGVLYRIQEAAQSQHPNRRPE